MDAVEASAQRCALLVEGDGGGARFAEESVDDASVDLWKAAVGS